MTAGLISPIFAIFAAPPSPNPGKNFEIIAVESQREYKISAKNIARARVVSLVACYIKTQGRERKQEKKKKKILISQRNPEAVVLIKPHPRVYTRQREGET